MNTNIPETAEKFIEMIVANDTIAIRIGMRVASPGVTVVDDGTIGLARGSICADDEGTPARNGLLLCQLHSNRNSLVQDRGRRQCWKERHPAALRFGQGIERSAQMAEQLRALQQLLRGGFGNAGRVFNPVLAIEGILCLVADDPPLIGGLVQSEMCIRDSLCTADSRAWRSSDNREYHPCGTLR